tara:strand:+ start:235 stop:522 length:288 start_codon:yes stop_codon:yes gene_type:complete
MQADLLAWTPPDDHRDGATYSPAFDYNRLNAQQQGVYNVMSNNQWWTLRDISDLTGYPESSVSARIRDFRKPKFGGLTVERRRLHGGLWKYRIAP